MSKYNTFLTAFIISIIAAIVFMVFYLNAIFGFAFNTFEHGDPTRSK